MNEPPTDASTTANGISNPVHRIVMYWRPGCGFCRSLAAGLQDAGVEFDAVNIWEDPEAAAFVRSVASGNEVVPTIRVGGTSLVNPTARDVLLAAAAEIPGVFGNDRSNR